MARRPTLIRTILGSCVGVTFWSAKSAAGALCHALLPRYPADVTARWCPADGYRFVDSSIRGLARQFDEIGASRREIQVKVFGGADVLPVDPANPRPTVGRMNGEVAMQVLQDEGFAIIVCSLGGTCGRSIQFHTGTGEVRMRWLAAPPWDGASIRRMVLDGVDAG